MPPGFSFFIKTDHAFAGSRLLPASFSKAFGSAAIKTWNETLTQQAALCIPSVRIKAKANPWSAIPYDVGMNCDRRRSHFGKGNVGIINFGGDRIRQRRESQ
jgi:hypothetical protein